MRPWRDSTRRRRRNDEDETGWPARPDLRGMSAGWDGTTMKQGPAGRRALLATDEGVARVQEALRGLGAARLADLRLQGPQPDRALASGVGVDHPARLRPRARVGLATPSDPRDRGILLAPPGLAAGGLLEPGAHGGQAARPPGRMFSGGRRDLGTGRCSLPGSAPGRNTGRGRRHGRRAPQFGGPRLDLLRGVDPGPAQGARPRLGGREGDRPGRLRAGGRPRPPERDHHGGCARPMDPRRTGAARRSRAGRLHRGDRTACGGSPLRPGRGGRAHRPRRPAVDRPVGRGPRRFGAGRPDLDGLPGRRAPVPDRGAVGGR